MTDHSPEIQRLERWAALISRRGLAAPALMLLELSKPLGSIASNCVLLFAPFVPQAGRGALDDLVRLLDDPEAADAFAAALSEQANDKQSSRS